MQQQFTVALTQQILLNARQYEWSIQGFGMLRLHLRNDFRLAIWNSKFQVPNVSLIHDHPWDFESLIINGMLVNNRYTLATPETGRPYFMKTIKPGIGLADVGGISKVYLTKHMREAYRAGNIYRQEADEIHETSYTDGTITLVKRFRGPRPDLARTCWAEGDWVSAEPRIATTLEVSEITEHALSLL